MDVHNLATLFGPNILRRSQAGGVASASDKELMYQQSGDRVEESKEVIEVVKDMIDNHHDLFEVSCKFYSEWRERERERERDRQTDRQTDR